MFHRATDSSGQADDEKRSLTTVHGLLPGISRMQEELGELRLPRLVDY